MKTTDKNNVLQLLYKYSGDFNQLELLRLSPKSGGFSCYLPSAIVKALNLHESDRSLVGFVDDESNFTYLILVKDSDLAQQLRPLIYEKRRKAELLHKELKRQFETQKQQNVASVDAEVIE